MIEQVADAAAHQLDGAGRQNARLNDAPKHELGEICGARRGLDDGRHSGEQRRRELLEHAPDREIESIDLHRRALERHADMLAEKSTAFRQGLGRTVNVDTPIGQLAHALAGIDEKRGEAAIDVEPRIVLGRARAVREGIELLFVRAQCLGEAFQEAGPLMEGKLAQRCSPDAARVLERGRKIDARRAQLGDRQMCIRDRS